MRKLTYLVLFLLMLSCHILNAQDLMRTNKDTLRVKVLEIGIDEIKYHDFDNPTGPIFVIPKTDVIGITFENGTRYNNIPDPYDVNKEIEIRHKRHAIKFEFFSPLTNDIAFGYESMLKVGTNLEFKVGIIGPGTGQNQENASGAFVKGGVKFLKTPSHVQRGAKFSHGLAGSYIKPEIIFNNYSVDGFYYTGPYNSSYQTKRINHTNFCFDIVFGKQSIIGNIMTIDYYFGVGYGFHSSNEQNGLYSDYNGDEYAYSHLYFGKDFPMILTAGLTIGVLY